MSLGLAAINKTPEQLHKLIFDFVGHSWTRRDACGSVRDLLPQKRRRLTSLLTFTERRSSTQTSLVDNQNSM